VGPDRQLLAERAGVKAAANRMHEADTSGQLHQLPAIVEAELSIDPSEMILHGLS
jgi:hypothetical protein